MKKAWLDPYTAETGVKIVIDETMDTAKFQTMVDTNNVTWDILEGLAPDFGFTGTPEGAKYLEPLDYALIDGSQVIAPYKEQYKIGEELTGVVLGYNTKVLGAGNVPTSWADFFDLQKFPGKRGVPKSVGNGAIEIALVADGVKPADLYPLDVARAIKKLDTIKSSIVFWDTGAQSAQLLSDGEVSMEMAWNGRVFNAAAAGAPLAISWTDQRVESGYLAIAKGAPDKAEAMKLIAYIMANDGKLAKFIPYGPPNAASKPDPSFLPNLPTTYLAKGVGFNADFTWWKTNRSAADALWQAWLLK